MKQTAKLNARAANQLRAFLRSSERPNKTLNYNELKGFLFSLACAPQAVTPSQWLPVVFNNDEANYRDQEEADAILGSIFTLYNQTVDEINSDRPRIPANCKPNKDPRDDLDAESPLSEWARGFTLGHGLLEHQWQEFIPEELNDDLGSCVMVLSFFADRELAERYYQDFHVEKDQSLEEVAASISGLIPHAITSYANIGRSIQAVLAEHPSQELH